MTAVKANTLTCLHKEAFRKTIATFGLFEKRSGPRSTMSFLDGPVCSQRQPRRAIMAFSTVLARCNLNARLRLDRDIPDRAA